MLAQISTSVVEPLTNRIGRQFREPSLTKLGQSATGSIAIGIGQSASTYRMPFSDRFQFLMSAQIKSRPSKIAPILALRGIGKRFGGVTALDDVSLEIQPGHVHAICGENGAGKSTLMKILAGVIGDYTGTILLDGQSIQFQNPREAEQAGISIIHQELNLVGPLSVAANIYLGREKTHALGLLRDDRAMRRAAGRLLEQLECSLDPETPVSRLRRAAINNWLKLPRRCRSTRGF